LQADTESRVQQCVTYFYRVCQRSFRWNVTNIYSGAWRCWSQSHHAWLQWVM